MGKGIMIYDFIIVGGGPAAAMEAEKLSSLHYSVLIIADMLGGIMHVMGKENLQSYCNELSLSNNDIKLENYISDNTLTPTGNEFTAYVSDVIEQVNVKKEIGFVSYISKDNDVFCCDILKEGKPKKYQAKNVVIATGIKANSVPSFMFGTNFMTCLDAYLFFRKERINQFKNKRVVIVGSGNSAFQIARIAATFELEVTILATSYLGLFPQETNDKFALRAQSQITIERIWKTQTEANFKPLNFYIYTKIEKCNGYIIVTLHKKDHTVHIAKASYNNICGDYMETGADTKQVSFSTADTIFISATGTIPNIPDNEFDLFVDCKVTDIDLERRFSDVKGLYMAGSVIGCRSINTMKESAYEV